MQSPLHMIERTQNEGGSGLYDHGLGVLEQYGLTAKSVGKGRGALICETEQGIKCIREYWGSPGKMEIQRKLLCRCREEGYSLVDVTMENTDGHVVSMGEGGIPYVVRDWYAGRECDTRSGEDIHKSVTAMAKLHKVLHMEEEGGTGENLLEECRKHNRELRRIGKYVKTKKNKVPFEEKLAASMERFLEQGEKTVRELERSGYEQLLSEGKSQICHGECSQHNIIFTREGVAFMNFEHWKRELQTADLCQFMRKILEKNKWNVKMGADLMESYTRIRPLSSEELQNLKLQLSYPWKYWKIANFYNGSSKVWISDKNLEKLDQTILLADSWMNFIQKI